MVECQVECQIVESISTETARQTLKKTNVKPWLKECWCIPPGGSAEFACAMEDGLEVYHRQYRDNEVLVLPGRDQQATSEGDAPAESGPAWDSQRLRL